MIFHCCNRWRRLRLAAERADGATVALLLRGISAESIRAHSIELSRCALAAARAGCVEALLALHDAGVDLVIESGPLNATPSVVAAEAGHCDAIEALHSVGVDVGARAPTSGVTPAIVAARRGDDQMIVALGRCGADLDVRSQRGGASPAFVAAYEGHTMCIVALIRSGAAVNAPRERDGATPLHVAAQGGHAALAQLLMNAGAEIDGGDRTPLFVAASGGGVETAELLLRAGADANRRSVFGAPLLGDTDSDATSAMRKWVTPLAVATRRGDAAMVRALLRGGADVNAACACEWRRAIDSTKTRLKAQTVLLHGATVGSNFFETLAAVAPVVQPPSQPQPLVGATPLVVAAYHGHCDALRALASAPGVRLDRHDRGGRTAAHHLKERHQLALRVVILSPSVQTAATAAARRAVFNPQTTRRTLRQRAAAWWAAWWRSPDNLTVAELSLEKEAARAAAAAEVAALSYRTTCVRRKIVDSDGLYGPGMLLGCGVGLGCGCCAPESSGALGGGLTPPVAAITTPLQQGTTVRSVRSAAVGAAAAGDTRGDDAQDALSRGIRRRRPHRPPLGKLRETKSGGEQVVSI